MSQPQARVRPAAALYVIPEASDGETTMSCPTVEGAKDLESPGQELDQLELHLQSRLSGRVRDFRLVPRGRGLRLRGRAGSYHGKQLAQHAVMETVSLPILSNEIEVK